MAKLSRCAEIQGCKRIHHILLFKGIHGFGWIEVHYKLVGFKYN